MTNKLLLIDGHNLLVQMFYGMPNKMEGKNGKSIEGIWGFTGALLKMISQTNPTHICVIFEKEETYYQWKEQEKNPFLILPDIKSVLEKLNISYFETEKFYKTSDYIKEYCNQYKESCEIIISSWDYNYISLVSSHINLLTYKGNNSIRYTYEKVLSKWKVEPKFFADYKALVGDLSDSIAGIPRVGPKMASELIKEFGHVEDILEHIEEIKKDNIRLTLDIFKKDLLQNIKQIRFHGTGYIKIPLEKLTFSSISTKTKEILVQCDLLEVQVQPA